MAVPETVPTDDKPAGITCEQYVRGEGKRCRHYLPNGACSLPGEFMCSEWLKKNGQRSPPPAKNIFGNPLAEQPSLLRRGLTTEDIEGFKSLRVEVCIRSEDYGDIWLVPAYTGQSRKEITPEHLATVARVLDAFPGSRVVAFDKKPPAEPANEGSPA